jgi:hypothetical protein
MKKYESKSEWSCGELKSNEKLEGCRVESKIDIRRNWTGTAQELLSQSLWVLRERRIVFDGK